MPIVGFALAMGIVHFGLVDGHPLRRSYSEPIALARVDGGLALSCIVAEAITQRE